MCFVHPLRHRSGCGADEGLYADSDGGWRLDGALDIATSDHLRTALSALPATGDVHLHVDTLRFCDVATTRVLVAAAARLHPASRLVLHNPPPLLRRVLAVAWPGTNPGLEIVHG